jgi:hypothetical protein
LLTTDVAAADMTGTMRPTTARRDSSLGIGISIAVVALREVVDESSRSRRARRSALGEVAGARPRRLPGREHRDWV